MQGAVQGAAPGRLVQAPLGPTQQALDTCMAVQRRDEARAAVQHGLPGGRPG